MQAPTHTTRKQILVVEADPGLAGFYETFFATELGCRVAVARDARQALGLLRLIIPDLILLDATMPGQDGDTFYRTLRECEHTRDTRVLITSDGSVDGNYEQSTTTRYLIKPFGIDDLQKRASALLNVTDNQYPGLS